ncbi:hypothetical protein H4218_004390 [Coemansia sp. IMI 209128]|nr:hypothetical protein H4218_004390 [Coemansia sp. IMI 209128]
MQSLSPFQTLPSLVVDMIIEYLEKRPRNSLDPDNKEHNQKKTALKPLINVWTLAKVAVTSVAIDLKSTRYGAYDSEQPCTTLVSELTKGGVRTLGSVDPFPTLSTLDFSGHYPFNDDVLFRGNGETLKNLSLPFSAITTNALGRLGILERLSATRMNSIRIYVPAGGEGYQNRS